MAAQGELSPTQDVEIADNHDRHRDEQRDFRRLKNGKEIRKKCPRIWYMSPTRYDAWQCSLIKWAGDAGNV